MVPPIITKNEANMLLNAGEGVVELSLDLGISTSQVQIKAGNVLVRGQTIPLSELKKVKDKACYFFEDNILKKMYMYSDETRIYYKFLPTSDWPTIQLSATNMHRFVHVSPKADTLTKIEEISPVAGKVLDTCCGLGYTAIIASETADEVNTFERDANMLTLAGYNPYSQRLFNNPKIKITNASIAESIKKFPDNYFDRVIHDPPTFKKSPELYSRPFYRELYRVMKKDGILYHYCPWPEKTKGKVFYMQVINGLKDATGFTQIEYHDKSSGIRAIK